MCTGKRARWLYSLRDVAPFAICNSSDDRITPNEIPEGENMRARYGFCKTFFAFFIVLFNPLGVW